jgi:hypothetical protein
MDSTGKHFLVLQPPADVEVDAPDEIVVLQNWPAASATR